MAGADDLALRGAARRDEARPLADLARRVLWAVVPWLPVIVLLAAWEAVAHTSLVTPFTLPALSAVLERIAGDAASGDLFIHVGVTVYRALVGFVVAGVFGIALGVLMTRSRIGRWFFDPLISVGFPMPKIAFLPIFILWFGFFDVSKVIMIAFNTFFPVVTATIVGIVGVERELIWSARNLGADERRVLWEIVLPAALPAVMTGLQVALPIALIVGILTEMAMGGYGIGAAMQTASRFADSRGVFAGIIEIAVVGYVMVKAMAIVRRRLLVWHPESADPSKV